MKNKSVLWWIIPISLIIVSTVGYFIYNRYSGDSNNNSNINSNDITESNKEVKKEELSYKKEKKSDSKVIYLYTYNDEYAIDDDGEKYVFDTDELNDVENAEIISEYVCETKECQNFGVYGDLLAVYDGKYYLYNYKKKTRIKLNIDGKYEDFYLIYYDNKVEGAGFNNYGDEEKGELGVSGAYNYKLDKVTIKYNTKVEYDDTHIYYSDESIKNRIVFGDCTAYNLDTGKKVHTFNKNEIKIEDDEDYEEDYEPLCFLDMRKIENTTYYTQSEWYEYSNSIIYNENYEKLTQTYNTLFDFTKDGNLIYSEDNKKVLIVDKTGKKLTESKEYTSVELIESNYISVVDNDGYLKLLDYEFDEKTKFMKWDIKRYSLYSDLSGWFEDKDKEGISLVILDKKIKKCDCSYEDGEEYCSSNCGFSYYYLPKTKKTYKEDTEISY